jgi:hypothetical protein
VRCVPRLKGPRAVPLARGWLGQLVALGSGHSARLLLLPFDFGEPAGDMGMLRIECEDLVQGNARFVKLALHQTRVPAQKGLVRSVPLGSSPGAEPERRMRACGTDVTKPSTLPP